MADPVATVEKIVRIGLNIKAAVDTVRHNEQECNEIGRRVQRFSTILSQLQQTGMISNSPAMSGALEDLEETLQQALELVTACQETSTIRRLITAGELSKKLRRVKDDILNKVMLASFAIHAHTTIVLLTIQAGGHNPLTQLPEDARLSDISCNIHSAEHDARSELNDKENILPIGPDASFAPLVAIRKLSLFELKAAINGGGIIGEGASWKVYKSVLNNGNVVAIKTFKERYQSRWWDPHDQFLLASKLQHKNIVKVLGYGREVGSSSMIMRMFKRKNDLVQERGYVWVEEYVPNGSLDMIIRDPRLDWPSLSRIIVGLAQGIHYLHKHHVVHRDVKPSNILLESDMNPKITDFDLSIVLNDGENEITDTRIAGTFGYLCPEYALHGIISVKNDVYGFGVTILETVSTTYASNLPALRYKTTIPYHQGAMKAWSAWVDGRMDELLDPSLFDESQLMEIKRCAQVGLLCTQDDRADRPTMEDVLKMLRREKELPAPKIPAYFKSSGEEELIEEMPDSKSSGEEESAEGRPASPSAWSEQSLSPR